MDLIMIAAPLGVDRNLFISYFMRELMNGGSRNVVVLRSEPDECSIAVDDGRSVDVETFNNACVSCSLKADLISALREIVKRSGPEVVIYETDHNARPATVIDAVKDLTDFQIGSIRTLVVLDAGMFNTHREVWDHPLRHQLIDADLVVIKVEGHVPTETIDEIHHLIRTLGYEGDVDIFNVETEN